MAAKSVSKKKAGSTRRSGDAGEKDRLIIDIKDRIAVLENELRLMQDITESKKAEIALRESEEKYHGIIEQSSDGFIMVDEDGVIVDFNPAGEQITGLCATDWIGKRLWDFNVQLMPASARTPGMREQMKAQICDAYRTGFAPWLNKHMDITLLRPDGEMRTVQIMTFPLRTSQGAHFGTFIRDVTERKRAEEALKLAQFTLETSEDEVAWMDSDARVIYVNDAACKALGHTRDELLSLRVSDLDPNFPAEKWPEFWREAREKGHLLFESTHRSRDGYIYPVEITVDFIKSGNREFISSFARNITKRKLAEEELKAEKAQAELYLDLMGHDISNMHQIAMGYLELARDLQHDDKVTEFLDTPMEVLQRSARLIRNVKKLQKLKDGVFQTQVVDVCQLLVDVQREFGAVPHKAITLNLNGREQCHVRANELLQDVFANLVGNAIKHTGERAEIIVDLDGVWNDGRQYCRVMVEDDGPGIPDDFKGKIFNRLLKGTDKAKGMGLGLYLVKSLVESYNGRVWVEDRVYGDYTKGARFVVMLPAIDN